MQLNITNKPNYFLTFFILKRERTNSLRFSRDPLGNIKLSLRARRFHLGLDLRKAKLSKMSRGLNTWLIRIVGHWEQFLAIYLAKVTIKGFQSEGDSIVLKKKVQNKTDNTPYCCCSVVELCLTLCDPMDCSTPVFPIPHHLLEFTQTRVHWVGDAIQPSHPLSSPSPPAFNPSQHQGLFPMSQFFTSDGQVLEPQLRHQSSQWIFRIYFL